MLDHNNERGPRPEHKECGICGGYPVGTGCSHQCPNSTHYYSPEQERHDDLHGYNDQYDGWGDPELADDAELEAEHAAWADKVNPNPATAEEQIADLDAHYPGGFRAWYLPADDNHDDIPF